MKVLICGLGIHGGGTGAALYFASRGHSVTVSDSSSADKLKNSIKALSKYPIRYDLGMHSEKIFKVSDLIVKNPGFPANHRLLSVNRSAWTSDFAYCLPRIGVPVVAITGTKGKSTTAALLSTMLSTAGYSVHTAGNMGISPFTVLEKIEKEHAYSPTKPILVLELSSWQLHDLRAFSPKHSPFFSVSLLTSLFPDHQNSYPDFEQYKQDKFEIFSFLKLRENTENPPPTASGRNGFPNQSIAVYPKGLNSDIPVFPANTVHSFTFPDCLQKVFNRTDLNNMCDIHLPAATAAVAIGIPPEQVLEGIRNFNPLPHRQELIGNAGNVMFINDTAATVPEAVQLFFNTHKPDSIHLITGGTDKGLSLEKFIPFCREAASLHILGGSLSDKLCPLLDSLALDYSGPHRSMKGAFDSALDAAVDGDNLSFSAYGGSEKKIILLSPGAASFDLFLNEFDRGDQFRKICRKYISSNT